MNYLPDSFMAIVKLCKRLAPDLAQQEHSIHDDPQGGMRGDWIDVLGNAHAVRITFDRIVRGDRSNAYKLRFDRHSPTTPSCGHVHSVAMLNDAINLARGWDNELDV